MRNPMMKAVVAAAVVLVGLGAFALWHHVAIGALPSQAIAKIEQIPAFKYQITESTQGNLLEMPREDRLAREEVIISTQYGWRADVDVVDHTTSGALDHYEQYVFPRKEVMLSLNRAKRDCEWMTLKDKEFFDSVRDRYHLGTFIRRMLRCKCRRLGRKVIDGVEAEGFQTTDPAYCHIYVKGVDVRLWVDVRTGLPVRIEEEIIEESYPGRPYYHRERDMIAYGFQWNVPVAARDFDPVIPADYHTRGDTRTPENNEGVALRGGRESGTDKRAALEEQWREGMDEWDAIEGLRVCAMVTGRYPDSIDGDLSEIVRLLKENPSLKAQNIGLGAGRAITPEQKTRSIRLLQMFYRFLCQNKKETVYYGKVVTPGAADRVLLRWQMAPNAYRVIFGNLRSEVVFANRLAQLEAGQTP